jgi:hypothetical protein
MTEFNKEKAQEWISKYWTRPKECTVCGSDQWLLLDNVWELRKFERGTLVIGGSPILPVVALMCNVCGHLIFFNAIAVRAIAREELKEDSGEPKSS